MKTGVSIKLLPLLAVFSLVLSGWVSQGAQARTGGTVKIGVGEMLTGGSAYYGQAVLKGVQLAVEQLNTKGGILGKHIVLQVQDNASDNAQAVNIVRKYAGDPSIPAVIPPTYQPNFEAACAVANQLGLPVISAQSVPAPAKTNAKGYCFVVTSPVESQTRTTIAMVAKKLHVTRFAQIYDQQNLYQSYFDKVAANYIRKSGLKLLADAAVRGEATDYGPQITQLIQADAQVVIPNLTTEDAARFIQQARARGLKAIFLSPDTNLTNLRIYKLSAGAAEGLITATNQSEGDTPSYHAFVVAFTKRFGQVDDPSYSGYGYDAMMILAHAMTKAETTSNREAVKTALASMRSVCASICYKNDGHGAFLTPKLYFVKLVKGHWVPATELK